MLYAILTPKADAPLGYYDSSVTPTPEPIADFLANTMGFDDRAEWLEPSGLENLVYATVRRRR
ncbi:beta-lactoglobulin I [Burkholderia pseudomallei]|uniref:beta-lactoglobulin I n=1 Tax=Burkholderia pseudomallei TaxID=28450 RepID=UPI0021F7483F|nr:beta-lactoglobulin I [Burkholderia pseudomallei]MCV9986399.1 beta-lactoglobulin I [Burkholderia pseudomallei]